MTLGMLVTTNKYSDDILGITEAAVRRGHRVVIFFMDEGCSLITDNKIMSLKDRENVIMSLCDYNRKKIGIPDKEVPEGITCGSQYDNALMNKESDKVISF